MDPNWDIHIYIYIYIYYTHIYIYIHYKYLFILLYIYIFLQWFMTTQKLTVTNQKSPGVHDVYVPRDDASVLNWLLSGTWNGRIYITGWWLI